MNYARLEHPKKNEIEQGAIFNCVLVDQYDQYSCHGIVLTARCDLAHGKASTVNYLPIVPIHAWLRQEALSVVAKLLLKRYENRIHSLLRDAKVPSSIIETFSLTDVIQRELKGKSQKDCLKLLEYKRTIDEALSSQSKIELFYEKVANLDSKLMKQKVRELVNQQSSEYYFINAVDVSTADSSGFVVLLRRMMTLPREIAEKISRGVDQEEIHRDPELARALTAKHDPICMITGTLRSPDIEHLMQSFSHLYSRIGLEDQPAEILDAIIAENLPN